MRSTNVEMFDKIRNVIAGGSSSNMRVRGMTVPLVVQNANGARIRDVEGNELIDLNMGYGPHILGYADPDFAGDVARQLRDGGMTGLPHPLDALAGELIAELVPSVDQVRFASTGTEALMSAARLARMHTGRRLIVTFEGHYHGWSDTFLRRPVVPGTQPPSLEVNPPGAAPGMLPEALAHTLQIPWNDVDSLREVFNRYGTEIAAVFCEPVLANAGVVPPEPGFLQLLRTTTSDHDALLVFDEVITGFRVGRQGASGYYGVDPDITVLSKVIGGGFPVSAFGGNRDVMAPLARNEAFHAGVYAGNHAAMAAVVSMLQRIRDCGDMYEQLDAVGAYAEARVRATFSAANRPVWIGRVGSLMSVASATKQMPMETETSTGPALTDFATHSDLQVHCQRGGVYFHPDPHEPWFLSTKHTLDDIDQVCSVIGAALEELRLR